MTSSDFLSFLPLRIPLAATVVDEIGEAASTLERHPLIGPAVEQDLRELLMSRGKTGYVALYRYIDRSDVVLVLAIRHKREAGYEGPVG